MIKYGSDRITELNFVSFQPTIERRNEQWVDIALDFELAANTPAPDDLIDLSALVICTADGAIAQMIPLDEDCDCEYQFTAGEKEQIAAFINQEHIQAQIRESIVPA